MRQKTVKRHKFNTNPGVSVNACTLSAHIQEEELP